MNPAPQDNPDAKEIADMHSAGATYDQIVSVYNASAERWEAMAAKHEAAGNTKSQSECLAVAVALRRVALLSAKLGQQAESICAYTGTTHLVSDGTRRDLAHDGPSSPLAEKAAKVTGGCSLK